MNQDAEFRDLFDEVGNDPTAWAGKALALIQSAEILKQSHSENSRVAANDADAHHAMNMQQVFVMLRGMGVECLLKAAWAENVKALSEGGKYQRPASTNPHDLVLLEAALDEKAKTGLSLAERMVLARMSMQIVMGRYPIGTKVYQSPALPPGGGSPYLMSWTENDELLFHSLLKKLFGLVASTS